MERAVELAVRGLVAGRLEAHLRVRQVREGFQQTTTVGQTRSPGRTRSRLAEAEGDGRHHRAAAASAPGGIANREISRQAEPRSWRGSSNALPRTRTGPRSGVPSASSRCTCPRLVAHTRRAGSRSGGPSSSGQQDPVAGALTVHLTPDLERPGYFLGGLAGPEAMAGERSRRSPPRRRRSGRESCSPCGSPFACLQALDTATAHARCGSKAHASRLG